MGFLDFLKKDKQAPMSALPPPPPDAKPSLDVPPAPEVQSFQLPQDPAEIDWASPPKFESVPLPPVSKQNPNVFDDPFKEPVPEPAQQTPEAPQPLPASPEPAPEHAPEPAQPVSADPSPASAQLVDPAKIELPDFTDDDLAAADVQWSAPQPTELPALPPAPKAQPKVEIEAPVAEPPANAVAIPQDEVQLPTGETLEMKEAVPAKFISSDAYFTMLADIKAMRRSLRQNDELVKEANLHHEQLDAQFKRVAADINAVQEQFMKIDTSLFEEG